MNNSLIFSQNQSSINYFVILSYLLKSSTFFLPFLRLNPLKNNDVYLTKNNENFFFLNDLLLNLQDVDILNKDTLNSLITLTNSGIYSANNRFFFNHLNDNFLFEKKNQISFFFEGSKKNEKILNSFKKINYYLLLSLVDKEIFFLNDLKYFTLFF